jgi:hypothetical protein
MKSVKFVIAFAVAALLSGCVVYPVGYRGGYYGGGHHHHHHHGGGYRR